MVHRRLDDRFKVLAERSDQRTRREKTRRAAALFHAYRDWQHCDDCIRSLETAD